MQREAQRQGDRLTQHDIGVVMGEGPFDASAYGAISASPGAFGLS
jgi:hypothetical protein